MLHIVLGYFQRTFFRLLWKKKYDIESADIHIVRNKAAAPLDDNKSQFALLQYSGLK